MNPDRRRALQGLGASFALPLAACSGLAPMRHDLADAIGSGVYGELQPDC
jgi:hypothetical protein